MRPVRLALLLLLGACQASAPRPTARTTQFDDLLALPASAPDARIAYGADPQQFGELRLPAGAGPFPLVVLVHGGCWRAAFDRTHDAPAATALTRAGIATWLVEYRRVGGPGGGWPGTMDDVDHAVAYVARLAERYPIDRARVVLAGHSAGGQLVLHTAAVRAGSRVAPADPLTLRAVVSLAGITDLRAYASPSGCGSAVVPLVGGSATEVPERYSVSSPIERPLVGAPVRLVHGDADPIVPPDQSRHFADVARARGADVVLTVVPGAGHFDLVDPTSDAWPMVLDVIRRAAQP
jgi:acetyl esterase/lipase